MKDCVLGLDVSTSCVGWSILDKETMALISQGALELRKEPCMMQKALRVGELLSILHFKYAIVSVGIEENLQAFRPGLSSAKTLMTLARFNGIVEFACFMQFDFSPQFINVNKARKSVGLKIDRKSSFSTKEQVQQWVSQEVGEAYSWPTKKLKSGPRKGLVILQDCCYDISDAYIISRALLNEQRAHSKKTR